MTESSSSRSKTADREIVIERVFDAPRDLVFRVWTDPDHAAKWWAPAWCEVEFLEMDVRPGGVWKKCMRDADGSEFWRSGKFVEVIEPEWLVFTYYSDDSAAEPGHETMVTVKFEEQADGKAKLTLSQAVFESVESRDGHLKGWTSTVERFGTYVGEMT